MSNKNKTCPTCSKKFHACSSCGLENDFEYNYCSFECYTKSTEYKQLIEIAEEVKQVENKGLIEKILELSDEKQGQLSYLIAN